MSQIPVAAYLVPELCFPRNLTHLTDLGEATIAEGRGFEFQLDLIIRSANDGDSERLGLMMASDIDCAARALIDAARDLPPFDSLLANPNSEAAVTADDLDRIHHRLSSHPTFATTWTNRKSMTRVAACAKSIRSLAKGYGCTLKLAWASTQFPVSATDLPWLLPRLN